MEGGLRTKGILKQTQKDLPLITVITVVYNRILYLEQAILSVLGQTYKNIEYIIIDGGSDDGTLNIIQKYEGRLDYWISEPDKGMYYALNKGIALAKGEIIGVCHSDDYYFDPDVINGLVVIHNDVRSDIYHGDAMMIFDTPNGTFQRKTHSDSSKILRTERSIIHPATFISKNLFSLYGDYDTKFRSASDYELLLRFTVKKCTFFHLDTIISGIRVLNQDRVSNNCYSHIEAYKSHKMHHTGYHRQYIFSFIKCWLIKKGKKVLISLNIYRR